MKKLFTPILFFILLAGNTFAQTIPNASFEDWQFNQLIDADSLLHWRAKYDYFNEDQPIIKSSDAFKGDASVMVQIPTFGDSGVYTIIGYADFKEDALTGYYKADLEKGDSAAIVVQYVKKDYTVKTEKALILKESVGEWTYFQLQFQKTQNADSIKIAFYPSLNIKAAKSTSKLWIDNISFGTYVAVEKATELDFSVYPNPASSIISVRLNEKMNNDESTKIELLDLAGRVLQTYGRNQTSIPVAQYQPGMYMVRVSSKSGSVVKNVMFN
ncbi:T9SS type A sorting domain-containing protein [bacterium]|nr:T9SS type A sorting domain-containing protein [bacterium]